MIRYVPPPPPPRCFPCHVSMGIRAFSFAIPPHVVLGEGGGCLLQGCHKSVGHGLNLSGS